MYIDENEAKTAIENVVKNYTDDFRIYPIKRKAENLKKKVVFFIVQVLVNEQNEELFNDFMLKAVEDDNMEIIESSIKEDAKSLKELFLVKCQIDVFVLGD